MPLLRVTYFSYAELKVSYAQLIYANFLRFVYVLRLPMCSNIGQIFRHFLQMADNVAK